MTTNRCLLACALLLASRAGGRADDIRFEVLGAETTGIKPVFEKWYDDEMRRQGGPGKASHGWWPWGLRAFDFDRDGRLDLLASHHGVPRSIVLRSVKAEPGQFRFVDATKELGVDSRDLPMADDRPWVWDFDGDGWLDVAGFSDESPSPAAWNVAGKELRSTKTPLFRGLAHPREVIDLDGDGYLDVDGGAKGRWFYDPGKRTFRHDPKPRFARPDGFPAELLPALEGRKKANRFFAVEVQTYAPVGFDTLGYDPRPIDLDGDGRPDAVVQGSGGYGAAYLGRYLIRSEAGKLVDRTSELGLPEAGAPILVADLTGDGRPEILVAGEADSGLYLNGGTGRFTRAENALTRFLVRRGPYLVRAYPADLDNDGRPDLVVSNPRLGLAGVFRNRGGGDFTQVLSIAGCWDSNPIVVGDFDGDGRTDLVVGGGPGKDSKKEITMYLNRTAGAGNHVAVSPRMPAPNPYAVGAVVEVFRAGELGRAEARPVLVEKAHPDATPVHAGLGKAGACDVRVTFPGGKTLTARGVTANTRFVADAAETQPR
jgi:hypothetical protein